MNDTYFNKEYYANMTDRAPVKSTMQLITDRIKKQQQENASKAAITGATDESQLAAGQGQAEAYDQTLKGLAENETQIQQSALERKRVEDNNIQEQQNILDQEKAESTQNLINNATSLGQTVAGADFSGVEKAIGGIFKKK
jgi:thiazole synthase ThiGH ThiG subunit